jgi:hypothetical protein
MPTRTAPSVPAWFQPNPAPVDVVALSMVQEVSEDKAKCVGGALFAGTLEESSPV